MSLKISRTLFLLVVVLVCFLGPAAVADGLPVFVGEDAGRVWVEIELSSSQDIGFRLMDPPPGGQGVRLLVSGMNTETARAVTPGLEHLQSFLVEPTVGGVGSIISLPFSLQQLRSVDGLERGGWRFTFQASDPATAIASESEDDYLIGVRDALAITVFGHENLSKKVEVPANGSFDYPLAGVIQLAGKTVNQVQSELTERLGKDYLVDPTVDVRVEEYLSRWVNVVGHVEKPGKYYLKGQTSLIDVLTQSGGFTLEAGAALKVSRNVDGQLRQIHINRSDLLSRDNAEYNIALRMGDVVEVGEQEMFFIQGEVARPGSYRLEPGYTLLKAITVAGGLSQWADRKKVELLRDQDGEQLKLNLNLKAIGQRKEDDVELKPEDIIIVKRRLL